MPSNLRPARAARRTLLCCGAFALLLACNKEMVPEDVLPDAALPGPAEDLGAAADLSQAPARPPNFLLLIADDVGIAEIGAYGQVIPGATPATTRVIDALAARGVQFNQMWATPACSPTRATLYTGRYSFRTGVGAALGVNTMGQGELKGCEITLPEALATRGYSSALFGKWHLGTGSAAGNDSARQIGGFNHHAGAQDAALTNFYNWTRYVDGVGAPSTTYATTQNVNDAVAWIGAQKSPWLAVMAFNAAHGPFHKPPSELYQGSLDGVLCTAPAGRRACYQKMIEALDTEIGRLLRAVDAGNTWIFFLGDNGTPGEVMAAGFDSTRAKFTVYQMGLRVPFIVAGPGIARPGSQVDAIVNSTDVYATIAALAGVSAPSARDGSDLSPHLTGRQATPRSTAYADTFRGAGPHTANASAALNDGRYKIIEREGVLAECYDLKADPGERTNLIGGSTPAACASLHAAMEASHLAGVSCP
jgi:arylsulfatase A-like enzyme